MILSDVQTLTPGNLVTLYELDLTSLGGDVERYHPHNDGEIIWQGKTYYPWAITAENFERNGEGQQPTPSISVSNIGFDGEGNRVTGVVTALCLAFDDLVGANMVRKRTFAKYLDSANFDDPNPDADPDQHLPDERWQITQKSNETPEIVTFSLGSPMQVEGVKLPRRQVLANVCGWLTNGSINGGYRGPYCGYEGSAMFDADGNSVDDPAEDICGGKPSDCKLRFGENAPLSYGGFPASDKIR